ncbi:MAG: (2Fe-2S)-binding protein [Rhodospirillaceae bacterium]
MSKHEIAVTVNGRAVRDTVDSRMTLLDFLRERARLTGTHMGCEHGVCGACSVIYDGVPVRSCSVLAVQADGKAVTTVEGLTAEDGAPGLLQQAFQDAHAMQCGYCIPGMLVAAHALLEENPSPDLDEIKEAIGGNICRCTGYVQIVEAIQLAAQRMAEARS